MRLPDFIEQKRETILQQWENFARTIEPPAMTMSGKALRNHASHILDAFIADLRTPQTAAARQAKSEGLASPHEGDTHAEIHGSERLDSGFSIEQLVSEYRALRTSVLTLWCASPGYGADPQAEADMVRFNEAIDQALAESVARYAHLTRSKLEAEQTRKDEFLAMLAHELRNPLAPIRSAASLLELGVADEATARKVAEIIVRQVGHITGIVDDLLDVSRVNKGLIEIERRLVNVHHIVADAVEQAGPLVRSRRHRLAVHLPPDTAVVSGDGKRLVQVLANLLTNAAKYTPDGGDIVLSAVIEPEQVLLTVEDNGIGIADDLREHIFDLFTQARRTPDRTSGGLGLGLALVKKLVALHHGTVECASAGPHQGSRFSVRLPRVTETDIVIERRRMQRDAGLHGPVLKVMVVDDNTDAVDMLQAFLSRMGHRVVVAQHPARALELAAAEAPDVFLLDIGLPGMDGLQLVRALRSRPAHADAVFIAITGYGQDLDRQKSGEAGFDRHLVKPVDLAELSRVLAAPGTPAEEQDGRRSR